MPLTLIQQLQNIINNTADDETEILHSLRNLIYETEIQNNTAKNSNAIAGLLSESLKLLEYDNQFSHLIKTGFTELDKVIGGFSPGELIVLGARPGMGKTQMLVNLSLHISQTNPLLFFTFDLNEFMLTHRFLSALSEISLNKMLHHLLSAEEKATLNALEKDFSKYKIFINDRLNSSISALKAHCAQQIQQHNIKVVVVDYLQMISSHRFRNSREAEISLVCRELKNIAKEYNVCVIASSQLSRAVESRGGSKHPQLSDLRDSGAIEQDADKVIFIYRPEYYGLTEDENLNNTAGITELIVAKNRNGKLGSVKLQVNKNFTRFKEFVEYTNDFSFDKSRMKELNEESPL